MKPILIFVALVALAAFLSPGAFAQLPYDHVETHSLGSLSLPVAGQTSRDQRPLADDALTFTGIVPAFNPIAPDGSRRWLTMAVVCPTLVVSQRSSVTNLTTNDWSWGEWSQGFRLTGHLGNVEIGGGASVMGTCSWDHLAPGETKIHQSDPTLSLILADYVGPTERQWYGTGSKSITFSLAQMSQSSGFYAGHGQSASSMDIRLARPGLSWEVMVHYYWTEQHPSYTPGFGDIPLRFKVRETPWVSTPTWSPYSSADQYPIALEGRPVDPSRILRAYVEQYETRTISYGIEHLGQGSAVCAGDATTASGVEVGGATAWLTTISSIGGGGAPGLLQSFDGAVDWIGQSGLRTLPNITNARWGMLAQIPDASAAAGAVVPATWHVDPQASRLDPQSSYQLAWGGNVDVQVCARLVTIEAP